MFFYSVIFANTVIVTVLSTSISTTYGLCKYFNVPFYNEEELDVNLDKIRENVLPIYFGALYMVLTTINYGLDDSPTSHSFFRTLFNIVLYSVFVEGVYYGYHRMIHHPSVYKSVHSLHHTKKTVYPLDATFFTPFDLSCYMACLHLPNYFIQLSTFEYMVILYFYITMGFVSHSDIAYKHHLLHHIYYKYNFCLVFPVFDMIFDTYRDSDQLKGLETLDQVDTTKSDTDEPEFVHIVDDMDTKKID